MNFTLLITVLVTAITLVVAAYVVAKLIGPRSYAKVKGEPYESGIPTRGSSWLPISVGFYLFAILFVRCGNGVSVSMGSGSEGVRRDGSA